MAKTTVSFIRFFHLLIYFPFWYKILRLVLKWNRTYLLVDPSEQEERVMDGLLVIAMNKHREICTIQSSGGIMLLKEQVTWKLLKLEYYLWYFSFKRTVYGPQLINFFFSYDKYWVSKPFWIQQFKINQLVSNCS